MCAARSGRVFLRFRPLSSKHMFVPFGSSSPCPPPQHRAQLPAAVRVPCLQRVHLPPHLPGVHRSRGGLSPPLQPRVPAGRARGVLRPLPRGVLGGRPEHLLRPPRWPLRRRELPVRNAPFSALLSPCGAVPPSWPPQGDPAAKPVHRGRRSPQHEAHRSRRSVDVQQRPEHQRLPGARDFPAAPARSLRAAPSLAPC